MDWIASLGTFCRLAVMGLGLGFACAPAAMAGERAPVTMVEHLSNPYRLDPNWAKIPVSMNGGKWGEVIRVDVDKDNHVWVFHRCFNTVPPGHATCINRGPANPPILEFDADGNFIKGFGAGLFAYPHGFTVDDDGNVWASDVNDEAVVLDMPARTPDGTPIGQQVTKLDGTGKVIMRIGEPGVAGSGPDRFDRPTGIAIGRNGDIFVSDGHTPNSTGNARIMKFDKAGKFLKQWGRKGAGPGEFAEPHDLFIGGSRDYVYVADRRNNRIQLFDQEGEFVAEWPQFGQPSSVYVDDKDRLYVGASYTDPAGVKGERRGIVVGNALTGELLAFIPDDVTDVAKVILGTSASGIAADAQGNIYAVDVGGHNLRRYVPTGALPR